MTEKKNFSAMLKNLLSEVEEEEEEEADNLVWQLILCLLTMVARSRRKVLNYSNTSPRVMAVFLESLKLEKEITDRLMKEVQKSIPNASWEKLDLAGFSNSIGGATVKDEVKGKDNAKDGNDSKVKNKDKVKANDWGKPIERCREIIQRKLGLL